LYSHFAEGGLELIVRHPVENPARPDTDEEMTGQVLDLMSKDETLKAAVSGIPKIRSPIRG
jgi:hypothetical protein